jgi:hypothetical protein
MDQDAVEGLRQQLAELRRGVEALQGQALDFPALTCNLTRVQASLKMIAINLGLTTVNPEGDF